MAVIIFFALFTIVGIGFGLTGILAVADELKGDKTLFGWCLLVSCTGGIVLITGLLIWLVWSIALA